MDDLLELMEEESVIQHGPKCGVALIRSQLTPEQRKTLDDQLRGEQYTGATITRALKRIGYHIGKGTITRHRRGDCGCQP